MSKVQISAIILASGFSKRYGEENKLMSLYKGRPLISHVVETIKASKLFKSVVIVTQYDEIRNLYGNDNTINLVINPCPQEGITKSIKLGILQNDVLGVDLDGYMFFQGDQPLISQKTIGTLLETFEKNQKGIIVPVFDGHYGSPKIFAHRYKKDLLALKGDVGGKQIIQRYSEYVRAIPIEIAYENIDIDSEEDYTELEKRSE